ncbi:MAG: nitrilase-related carbon-nitrogen hydrolase [Leptospiraceae bacterium]
MRLALVSLNPCWEDREASFERSKEAVTVAGKNRPDLIVFPEMTLTGFSMNTSVTAENPQDSRSMQLFSELSMEVRTPILYGITLSSRQGATNTALTVDANGQIVARYDKVHPFSFAQEDQFFQAGNTITTASINDMAMGLTICYDLRFPELYTALSRNCQALVNIANWPGLRKDHWFTLLRARAIENQAFMVGVNRTGVDGKGIEYARSTAVVRPNGEWLSPLESEGLIDWYELDPGEVLSARGEFPTCKDRRPELYRSII